MIEIKNLSKWFGSIPAVQDLSLQLVPGEILGFLGPNGAGKSTTMKMLTGFLKPSSGDISIYGNDVLSDPLSAQQLIGYLPEGAPCYDEMTPLSFLRFIAEVRGFRGAVKDAKVETVVQKMSLEQVLNQKIETLSKGFKRRVGLAQAILHDPKVLILDEPTDGLDPNQKHQVRELIQGLSKDKIVIISTHILEEVTAVCNRVVIIAEGRVVSDSTPEALEKRSKYHGAVSVRLIGAGNIESLIGEIEQLSAVHSVETTGQGFTVFPAEQDDLLASLNNCLKGYEVESLFREKGRLDDVFKEVTLGQST